MIDQYIRASCRCGQSGSPGLQTWSKSPGITAEEELELARATDYRWRRSVLLGNKAFETLPVALGFRRLHSGRWALFQSRPVLTDHVGRPGSHVAHAFVFTDAVYGAIRPAALYWESPSFRNALNEREVQATTRPTPLPVLAPEDMKRGADDLRELFPALMQTRGAEKVTELLQERADRPGPVVIGGPVAHVLLAILARELYRNAPVSFLTFVGDSGFNQDPTAAIPYEMCGEFGSQEVAKLWHSTHQAWLFEWDTPPSSGVSVPGYIADFVAQGGELLHHRYMALGESHDVIPKIDGWLRWHERLDALTTPEADGLLAHAVASQNRDLRLLALDRLRTTPDPALQVLPDATLGSLIVRIAQDRADASEDADATREVVDVIRKVCRLPHARPETLAAIGVGLRSTPVARQIRQDLIADLQNDPPPVVNPPPAEQPATAIARRQGTASPSPPVVAARMASLALVLEDGDTQAALLQVLRQLILERRALPALLAVSYASADGRTLTALCDACRDDAGLMRTLEEQLADCCESVARVPGALARMTGWMLECPEGALVVAGLARVLATVRLHPDDLRRLLEGVASSTLDADGAVTQLLIRACGERPINVMPAHLEVLILQSRRTGRRDTLEAVLRVAEDHASGIARTSVASRRTLLGQIENDLQTMSRTLEFPRLGALVQLTRTALDPRPVGILSTLRTHKSAVGDLDGDAREVLLTDVVSAALRVRIRGDRPIRLAVECLDEFRKDIAAKGLLSQVLDATHQPDRDARLDTLVMRVQLSSSDRIAPYVHDDVLSSWLVQDSYLYGDLRRRARQMGAASYDVALMNRFGTVVEAAGRSARAGR